MNYDIAYFDLEKTLELLLYGLDHVYNAHYERVKSGKKKFVLSACYALSPL